jgi:hypothetical protein
VATRSRSGTARASSTSCRSRRSCCWPPRSKRSRVRSTRTFSSTPSPRSRRSSARSPIRHARSSSSCQRCYGDCSAVISTS